MEKKIGVEIEFTGVKRIEVVTALENLFKTVAETVKSKSAGDYSYHRLKDMNGDSWLVVRDRSILPEIYSYKLGNKDPNVRFKKYSLKYSSEAQDYMVELVSPALTSKSLPLLFTIIDIVKSLGGIVNSSCGLHVHIDRPESISDIVTLYKRFCLEQDNILSYFNVESKRLDKYCKPYNKTVQLPENVCFNLHNFMLFLWKNYRSEEDTSSEVVDSKSLRYYALNFYSLLQHNTIEFRLFNSTLDRVEVAKILDWVLHFVYTSDDYNCYIPVLGGIISNELKVEAV